MPKIRVADVLGGPKVLNAVFNATAISGPLSYHCFVNSFLPSPASVLADFTECTTPGYSAQTVPLTGWTVGVTSSGTTRATAIDIAFTVTTTVNIYGYYVTDFDGNLLYSEEFDDPVSFGELGGTLTVTPTFELNTPIP